MRIPAIAYSIRNLASRKLLANPQGSPSTGATIVEREETGRADQEWLFDPPSGQAP